jgi:hypothetical protein
MIAYAWFDLSGAFDSVSSLEIRGKTTISGDVKRGKDIKTRTASRFQGRSQSDRTLSSLTDHRVRSKSRGWPERKRKIKVNR